MVTWTVFFLSYIFILFNIFELYTIYYSFDNDIIDCTKLTFPWKKVLTLYIIILLKNYGLIFKNKIIFTLYKLLHSNYAKTH